MAQHGAQTARVIRVRVGERDHIEATDWAIPEKGREHALAHVEAAAAARPAVDQDSPALGRLDERGIALSDVEERDS
jgi:hypothetical protein